MPHVGDTKKCLVAQSRVNSVCIGRITQITHQQGLFLLLLVTLQVWKKEPVQKPWYKALSAKFVLTVMLWECFGIASTNKQELAVHFFFLKILGFFFVFYHTAFKQSFTNDHLVCNLSVCYLSKLEVVYMLSRAVICCL